MKCLLTSDWHLTDNPRDEYRHQWQTELRKLIKENGVEDVLILGDLCEEKDRHSAVLVNRVVGHIHQLAKLCKVTILMGNHDYAQVGNPFWAFLNTIDSVKFYNQIENWPEPDSLLFLPHTRDWKKDWNLLDLHRYKLIFAHNTFEGADAGHGIKLSGIPTNIFADDAVVYAGDIHVPQTLGPVTYIGSPYTINFGDAFQPRVILLEGKTVTPIPCQGPQKMVAEADYKDGSLAFTKSSIVNIVSGDIVQVRVFLHREDYPRWHEIVEEAHAWGKEKDVTVFQVRPEVVDGKVGTAKNRRTMSARSDKEVFENYTKRMKIDAETVVAGEKLL